MKLEPHTGSTGTAGSADVALLPGILMGAALMLSAASAQAAPWTFIGDAVALSMTPEYLVQIGLLEADKVPSADKDIGLLLRQAMDVTAKLTAFVIFITVIGGTTQ